MDSAPGIVVWVLLALIAHLPPASINEMFLKEVGDKRLTQGFGEGQQTDEGSEKALGTKEIPRPDGGKDKVYYSVTTKEEEAQQQKEEREKVEKSWDLLRNIIIDKRSK
jgi:hypothetical protein